jgi:hypothetical protein
MAAARSFCPHCYAPIIAGRKTCPKCGRNVSDAPPSRAPAAQRGAMTFALLGVLAVLVAVVIWLVVK